MTPFQDHRLSTNSESEEVSVSSWVITLIITAIPLLNIVMYLYWLFSPSTNPSKRNFIMASIILIVLPITLVFISLIFVNIVQLGSFH